MVVKSSFTKEYCRPFNPLNEDLECPPDLLRIFEGSRHLFTKMASDKLICTPRSLLYKEERTNLEEHLSNMESMENQRKKDVTTQK